MGIIDIPVKRRARRLYRRLSLNEPDAKPAQGIERHFDGAKSLVNGVENLLHFVLPEIHDEALGYDHDRSIGRPL